MPTEIPDEPYQLPRAIIDGLNYELTLAGGDDRVDTSDVVIYGGDEYNDLLARLRVRVLDVIDAHPVFKIGITRGPMYRFYLAERDGRAYNYNFLAWDTMSVVFGGSSQLCARLETDLISDFRELDCCMNRRGGGGGRPPDDMHTFLYIVGGQAPSALQEG